MNKKLEYKLATHPIKQTSKQEGSASPSGSASPGSRSKRSTIPLETVQLIRLQKAEQSL